MRRAAAVIVIVAWFVVWMMVAVWATHPAMQCSEHDAARTLQGTGFDCHAERVP